MLRDADTRWAIGLKRRSRQLYRKARLTAANAAMRYRVRHGHRLVPENELKAKFREALTVLAAEVPGEQLGDYLEFGVYNGTSLSCMYRATSDLGMSEIRSFGFDSFEGMPNEAAYDDNNAWMPGAMKSDIDFTREFLNARGIDWHRVFLIKGWFSETLNRDTVRQFDIHDVSVVMIDCDIYFSAIAALHFCAPFIRREAVIFFDDWYSSGLAEQHLGEERAFSEFLEENPDFEVTPFGSYSEQSMTFRVRRRNSPDDAQLKAPIPAV